MGTLAEAVNERPNSPAVLFRDVPGYPRGFRVLFFAMVFAPLGFLLALAGSASGLERLGRIVLFSAGLVLPPLVFERAWIAVTCGVLNPYDLLWACGAIATGAALCECSFALLD